MSAAAATTETRRRFDQKFAFALKRMNRQKSFHAIGRRRRMEERGRRIKNFWYLDVFWGVGLVTRQDEVSKRVSRVSSGRTKRTRHNKDKQEHGQRTNDQRRGLFWLLATTLNWHWINVPQTRLTIGQIQHGIHFEFIARRSTESLQWTMVGMHERFACELCTFCCRTWQAAEWIQLLLLLMVQNIVARFGHGTWKWSVVVVDQRRWLSRACGNRSRRHRSHCRRRRWIQTMLMIVAVARRLRQVSIDAQRRRFVGMHRFQIGSREGAHTHRGQWLHWTGSVQAIVCLWMAMLLLMVVAGQKRIGRLTRADLIQRQIGNVHWNHALAAYFQ